MQKGVMRKLQVYHGVLVSYLNRSGLKTIGTRWVNTKQCDAANPFIRARLVAQESKGVSELTPEDASSTPPLHSLKFMLRRCMIGNWRAPADVKVLGFCDINRAHFHSLARRTFVFKVPRADDECKSGYAVLDNAMYGTKDEAQCFDVATETVLTAMGFDTGTFSPCPYHPSAADMSVFRHVDDFEVSGTRTQQKEFEEQLSKHLIVRHLATLRPCTALGDVTEVRILNRIVKWVKPPYGSGRERIEYEADPRHAEFTIHQLALSCSSRSVSAPNEESKPGADYILN